MRTGTLTVDTPTKDKVEATTATISCSASGWSGNSDISASAPPTPGSGGSGTSKTTSSTTKGIEYGDIKYHWSFQISGSSQTTSTGTDSKSVDQRVTGLTPGDANTITVSLYITQSVTNITRKQKWTREAERDEEGKITGYTSWEKDGDELDPSRSRGDPVESTIKTNTVTVYTKPSGIFTAWNSLSGYIDGHNNNTNSLKASDVTAWRKRCKQIINWKNQNTTTYTNLQNKAWDVTKGSTAQSPFTGAISADWYNRMINEAKATGLDGTIALNTVYGTSSLAVQQGTVKPTEITANHFKALAERVNF